MWMLILLVRTGMATLPSLVQPLCFCSTRSRFMVLEMSARVGYWISINGDGYSELVSRAVSPWFFLTPVAQFSDYAISSISILLLPFPCLQAHVECVGWSDFGCCWWCFVILRIWLLVIMRWLCLIRFSWWLLIMFCSRFPPPLLLYASHHVGF